MLLVTHVHEHVATVRPPVIAFPAGGSPACVHQLPFTCHVCIRHAAVRTLKRVCHLQQVLHKALHQGGQAAERWSRMRAMPAAKADGALPAAQANVQRAVLRAKYRRLAAPSKSLPACSPHALATHPPTHPPALRTSLPLAWCVPCALAGSPCPPVCAAAYPSRLATAGRVGSAREAADDNRDGEATPCGMA